MEGGIYNPSGDKSPHYYVPSASGRTPSENNLSHISVQTGEEFSVEFLQDRATPRGTLLRYGLDHGYMKSIGAGSHHNASPYYEDHIGNLGLRRAESDFSNQVSSSLPKVHAFEVNVRDYADAPGTPENPSSAKVKFLCSFGGKILPRPGDGKLRYVGGETRIISVKKNLSWKELMHKTTSICNSPHIVRYRLPCEDLDALISVSSDEDLQNMMDEYFGLEKADGSQRLRIFLIPLNEVEACSLDARGLQSGSEYQFYVAVNNMGDPIPKKSSSGNSLSNQVGCWLDRLPSFPSESLFPQVDTSDGTSSLQKNAKVCWPLPSSPIRSTPFSPKSAHQREMKHSPKQSFEDHFIAELPSESCYDLDRSCLMNMAVPMFQNRKCAPEFPLPIYTETDGYSADKSLFQEKNFHIEKLRTQKEDSVGWITSLKDPTSPIQGMPHAISDPLLHDIGDRNICGLTESGGFQSGLKNSVVPWNSFPTNMQEGAQWFQPMIINHSDVPSELQRTTALNASYMRPEFSVSDNYEEPYGRTGVNESAHQLECENRSTEPTNRHITGEQENYTKLGFGRSASDLVDGKINHHLQPMKYYQKNNDYDFSIVHGAALCSPNVQIMGSPLPTSSIFSPSTGLDKTRHHDTGNQFDETTSQDPRNFNNQSIKSFEERNGNLIDVDNNKMEFGLPASVPGDSSQVKMLKTFAERKNENIIYFESFEDISLPSLSSVHRPTVSRLHTSKDNSEQRAEGHGNTGPSLRICEGRSNLAFQMPENDKVCRQQFSLLDQDMINYSDPSARNTGLGNFSYETVRPEYNEPAEALVIVEDVTDKIPHDVPVAHKIIPHVLVDEADEAELKNSSQMVTDADSTPESECEDVINDERDNVGSKSDAAVAEIEAGIYGLQIIKNADLEELRELGSGTFGTVFHGKWRGTDVAIKRIKKSCFAGRSSEEDRLMKDFWREAQILSKLHHPNVVAFYGVVPDGGGGTLATVTEFMVNGSLRHVLVRKDRTLDRRKRLVIAMDAAFGMEYLHSKNIVHFDLKCDNLLVNLRDSQRPICKVGDFGLSRIKRNTLVSGGVRGTLPWMAPELLNGCSTRVSEKVDVFSFGIVMWEIVTGEEPYADMHCGAIIGGIVNNTLRPPVPEHCDAGWRKLMEQCWSADPSQRPSFSEITDRLRAISMTVQPKAHAQAGG
ncbi:Serine/threonine-protein kinase EDR1 [Platanthera zijinensis]|uniref:Serine/threonine-protein kinase EDR1 n=1 Tax=Platanthera zijinensis TaxID=2320716 RepID=A0AAP0C3A8_9ASPA